MPDISFDHSFGFISSILKVNVPVTVEMFGSVLISTKESFTA